MTYCNRLFALVHTRSVAAIATRHPPATTAESSAWMGAFWESFAMAVSRCSSSSSRNSVRILRSSTIDGCVDGNSTGSEMALS